MRLSLLQCTLGIGVFPIRICSGGQLQHRRREERDIARLLDCQHAGNSKDLASAGSPQFTKSCRRVDGFACLFCVRTWTRFLLLLLLPSTLGHPPSTWAARKEKIRSRRNILASIQIWRLFIANGYGELLPLRIDATDSQFRRPLPIGCGLFFGYHVLYLLPDAKGSEPSLLHF